MILDDLYNSRLEIIFIFIFSKLKKMILDDLYNSRLKNI